jgi:tRNA(fMet)-specific endonuclease VapC
MVSYMVKGRSAAARARLLGLEDDEVACISVVTEAEIRYGLAKRPESTALAGLMDGFLAGIRVLPWGRDEATAYGVVRAGLERKGASLGSMDMMIAAQAVAVGAVLVTNDQAFGQVESIERVENWATDL